MVGQVKVKLQNAEVHKGICRTNMQGFSLNLDNGGLKTMKLGN